ncbi:MAG: hypothetical protein ACWGQW_01245 [bacterium]
MADKVQFDPFTRVIQITQAPDINGEVSLDVKQDIYSAGKEDWRTDSTLNKLNFPLSAVGGNPLPGSKALGSTFFLANDWKIRPYEADHRLLLDGNLYAPDGTSTFVKTLGAYNVFLEQQVSSLVSTVVGSGQEVDYPTIASYVWGSSSSGHGSGTMGEYITKKILTLKKFLGLK